ncbi:transcriptional regulator [Halobacteriales archaeon QS_8_69_26]|nr:MAG: transcriptional regulator [Halobacteriales archaeon QS_8_69_26]
MVVAYVMVKANTGEADRLHEEVAAVEGVVDVHIVAGDVDLIAKIEVDTPGDVKNVTATNIQAIRGVETTQTYIAME